jgi:hypothetical protein
MTKAGSSAATGRWLYLSFYNWAVVVGWSVALAVTFEFLIARFLHMHPYKIAYGCRVQVLYCASSALLDSGHEVVYATVEWPLLLAQTASVMEVGVVLFL